MPRATEACTTSITQRTAAMGCSAWSLSPGLCSRISVGAVSSKMPRKPVDARFKTLPLAWTWASCPSSFAAMSTTSDSTVMLAPAIDVWEMREANRWPSSICVSCGTPVRSIPLNISSRSRCAFDNASMKSTLPFWSRLPGVENGNLLSVRFSSQPLPAVPGRLGWVIKRLGRNFGAPWR